MAELIHNLTGPWAWWSLAGLLLIGELLMPGIFLLWLALAAVLTGIVHLLFDLSWQTEVGLFALFSLLLVAAAWKLVRAQHHFRSDAPNLNQRQFDYIGRQAVLVEAISAGHGKVRLEDTLWDVEGRDLPKGAPVIVTGVDGARLKVEAVN
jgi:membrane protein implicated in regulation of membrane protease activity